MRRNTKTMYEWRKAYRDKEELMLERGFPEVSPHEFYRDLFPEGSLQSAEHCLLYTSPSPRDISGSRMPSSA